VVLEDAVKKLQLKIDRCPKVLVEKGM